MEKVHMKTNIIFSFVLFLAFGVYGQYLPNELLEIHYDNDHVNAIGSANTDFIIAAKFNQYILSPYVGDAIAQVKVYVNNPTVGNTGVVKIYGAGTLSEPGDLIYSSSSVHVDPNSWNTIPIPVLVTVPPSDLWIAFEATSGPSGSHSWAGCDSGPNDPDGQYIYYSGSWRILTALGASFTYNWNIRVVIETVTEVKSETLPVTTILEQNYPNPFNPTTTINFSLSHHSWVTLKVYNILGQEISVLLNNQTSAGNHSVNFNADKLPAGMYLYKLTAFGINGSPFTSVKKMLLEK
jgi:Secretion system C-terminal sorting domain